MRVIVDINHPAHVHFFKYPIRILRERGHDVLVASRLKDVTTQLLDELQIEHVVLSSQTAKGVASLARELLLRDWRLYRLARKWKADCLTAIGGTFSAHAGFLSGISSVVFYDTENARLQNTITYPFVTKLYVPRCYTGLLPKKATRYSGYHELSYLHPDVFTPSESLALRNGLSASRPTFLIRKLAWMANHDLTSTGWDHELLKKVVELLASIGKVLISSEDSTLDASLHSFIYSGSVNALHHVMAYSRLYIGESATMASECAVLGVPAIYAAPVPRGYTTEQENRYEIVRNIHNPDWDTLKYAVLSALDTPQSTWTRRREALLADTGNVTLLVADAIESAIEPQVTAG